MSQNLFLEVKKPEIKETKGTFIIPKLKSSYWGPFSGLKSQDLIKISRTFPCGLFCPRSFFEIFTLLLSYVVPVKSKVKILQNFVAFSEYMNSMKKLLDLAGCRLSPLVNILAEHELRSTLHRCLSL